MFLALLTLTVFLMSLGRHRRLELWLVILMVFIFALPRAGVIVPGINLPLPIAHVLAAALILEWLLFRRSFYPERTNLWLYFLLYAVVAGLGLGIGLATGGMYRIIFLELCFYLFALGMFFYVSETFLRPRHFYLFGKLFLVISAAVCIYGIAQRFFGDSVLVNYVTYNAAKDLARSYIEVPTEQMRRVLSSYGDPNVLASQLVVFAGMALALVLGRKIPSYIRLLAIGIVVLNVVCTIYTGSRAGIICLILVALIVSCWRSRWTLLVLPALILLGVIWLPQWFMSSRFASGLGSEDIRHQYPQMAWHLLQIVPLGCGWGKTVLLQIQGMTWAFEVRPATVVWLGFNSFWLTLFCRLGLPGVITFVLLLGALFKYVSSRARLISDPLVKASLIGILAGFVGQWLIWLVNNTYMLPGGNLNFWFTMGMLVAGCRAFAPRPYLVTLPDESPWLLGRAAPA